MNKYYLLLGKVLAEGKTQQNKKGKIKYLLNEQLTLTPADLLDIFESHGIARKKLKEELKLFMQGERNVERYREAGIAWWDYCGQTLVNSYPTYMEKQTLYNNIRKNDYPTSEDYLEGLTIESCDYRELYEKYKDEPNVVFIVDPPYLSTEVGTYKMYWHLSDYLDVLNVLKGKPFVYFTSDKSSIIELCEWLGKNKTLGNPFEGCKRFEFNAHVNYDADYKDMMLVKSNAA